MRNQIQIEKTKNSRVSSVDFNNIPFGRVFSDHMFIMEYKNNQWQNPQIKPFQNISLHPATSSIHYGQSIFEGMKAYKDLDNQPMMFRADENIKRMNRSADRMAMPEIPEDIFMEALEELIRLDHEWIPQIEGSSLYIRPFLFATDEYVGIKPSDNYLFVIFTCPVGPYYPFPVKVMVADKYVRAIPGGVGTAKVAGNYAATMKGVKEAREQGYDQILWMDGFEFKYIHEIGTMNVFFEIDDTIYTPSLEEGTILEGITRDSVIKLLNYEGIKVVEKRLSIEEVISAIENGTLKDAFGTGTAATISHISHLGYKGKRYELPPVEGRTISNQVKDVLENIKLGKAKDIFNWMHKIELSYIPDPATEE